MPKRSLDYVENSGDENETVLTKKSKMEATEPDGKNAEGELYWRVSLPRP
jgi:hypothetical protein